MADEEPDLYGDLYGGDDGSELPNSPVKAEPTPSSSKAPATAQQAEATPVTSTSSGHANAYGIMPSYASFNNMPAKVSAIPSFSSDTPQVPTSGRGGYQPVSDALPLFQGSRNDAPEQAIPVPAFQASRSQDAEHTDRPGVGAYGSAPIVGHTDPQEFEEGKMFIGGLNWETTDEALWSYFARFGKVTQSQIMRDPNTGRSRGFAFLSFDNSASVDEVLRQDHWLDNKNIDPKRAIPRPGAPRSSAGVRPPETRPNNPVPNSNEETKLFVRGVPQGATQQHFYDHFAKFGPMESCVLMFDRTTGLNRGYGFVTYVDPSINDDVLRAVPHEVLGSHIDVKRSIARPQSGAQSAGRSYNNDQFGGGGGYNQRPGPPASGPAYGAMPAMPVMPGMPGMLGSSGMPNQFDPVAMAAFFKQMGWANFNPMMMMGGMPTGSAMPNQGGMMPGMPGQPATGGQYGNRAGSSSSADRDSSSNAGGPERSSRSDRSYKPY